MLLWVWTLSLAFGGFTLWPSKLRGRGRLWPKVWTLDLALSGSTLNSAKGSTYLLYFVGYFQPISLDSQQSLATQSHSLWTAIV
jgi:hypothetical protein